jgi:hypothetical protein
MPVTRIRLSLIPPVGGALLGTVLALAVAFTPAAALDAVVVDSGLAGLAGARPPIGALGRLLLAAALGVGVGAVGWAALYLLFGTGGVFAREGGVDGMPQVRSADRHPDAPPRRPLSAADLSTRVDEDDDGDGPLPIAGPAAPIERPIPADLDKPLAEFDPRAVPAEPLAPARALPPLATPPPPKPKPAPLAPGERIDSFELSSRHAAESGASSVEALLARLERGTMLHQRRMRTS